MSAQRKQDLLLASQLARGQVLRSLDELSGQVDGVARRLARLRAWLSSPLVWMVGGATTLLVATALRRRVRAVRLLRWAWLALRLWRGAAALWRARRGPGATPAAMSAAPATPAARERYDAPERQPAQG